MDADWIVPQWQGPARVRAGYATRRVGDRFRDALPSDPVWLSQVHGIDVARVDAGNAQALRAAPPRADASVTHTPGVVLTVKTADCLPVLFASRDGTALGVAHAGWRGLAAGVLEATVSAMDTPPSQIVAWIGPAIGPTAFEVGRDVYDVHCADDEGSAAYFAPHREGKWLADLPALARRRLAKVGIARADGGLWCTHGDAGRFHSYRRDKATGRMALAAWIEDLP